MKKRLFAAAMIVAAAPMVAFAAPYSHTTAGSSTIDAGGGGDYTTLAAAIAAVNVETTQRGAGAGDWTFFIASNLTGEPNSALGFNGTASSRLIFKPASGVAPTVTFSAVTDNGGASGNLLIGTKQLTAGAISSLYQSAYVVIDGSSATNGTSRNLTITNSTALTHNNSAPIAIVGDADNITIKNSILINVGTNTSTNHSALSIRPRYDTPSVATPDNLTIENNSLQADLNQGAGIYVNVHGTTTGLIGAPTGYSIKNNDISARIRGIAATALGGGTIEQNRISVGYGAANTGFAGDGIFWIGLGGVTNQTMNILRNEVKVKTGGGPVTVGSNGINFTSVGNTGIVFNVFNNMVTVEAAAAAPTAGQTFLRALRGTSGVAQYKFYNNSVVVGPLTNFTSTQQPANVFGIGGVAVGSAVLDARNNIVRVNAAGGTAYHLASNVNPTLTSDYNTYFATASGVVGSRRRLVTFANRGVASNVATFTTSGAHGLTTGDQIIIALNTPNADLDGARTITSVPTTAQFTFATPSINIAATTTAGFGSFALPADAFTLSQLQTMTAGDANSNTLDPTVANTPFSGVWTDATTNNLRFATTPGSPAQYGSDPALAATITVDLDGAARPAAYTRGADETSEPLSVNEWTLIED